MLNQSWKQVSFVFVFKQYVLPYKNSRLVISTSKLMKFSLKFHPCKLPNYYGFYTPIALKVFI